MKKKSAVLALVLGTLVNAGVFAQGYPVMDVTAIMAAIQNGYTMAETLQAMYTNVRTSYDQLQHQIKNFELFDLYQLDANDPLGSWRSIKTYANRMKAYEQNIEAIINKKDIKIGNDTYSLGDVFMSPGSTMENLVIDGINYVLDPFEARLSPQERLVFKRKFGTSFGAEMRISQLGDMMKKKAAEVVGYAESLQKNINEDRERLESIVEGLFEGASIVKQQQINNAVMAILAQDTKTQAKLMGDIAQQIAMNSSQAQMMRKAMQEEINMIDLAVSEGYMKILKEIENSSSYR
jgi:hypothetical protein